MKLYLLLLVLICLIPPSCAVTITEDDFNRANNDSLGLGWYEEFNYFSIYNNMLHFNISHTGNAVISQYIPLSSENYTANITYYDLNATVTDDRLDISFYVQSHTSDVNGCTIEFRENSASAFAYWGNGTYIDNTAMGISMNNNTRYSIQLDGTNASIYQNESYVGYLDEWGDVFTNGTVSFRGKYSATDDLKALDDFIVYNDTAAGGDTAPNIDSYAPSTPNSTYENVAATYNATIDQGTSNNEWLINGTHKEWDNATDSPEYTNSTWVPGVYNLTLISHNSTDHDLTDSQTWIVTVLINNFDFNVTYWNPDSGGLVTTFEISNITAGWDKNIYVLLNDTNANYLYNVTYSNGTYVDSATATYENESLNFSIPLVEDSYNITETAPSTYNISGIITDNDGNTLTGVTVSDNQSVDSNTSYGAGIYNLTGYVNGTYNLTFTKTGFDSEYLEVTISGADNTTANKQIFDNTPPGQVTGLTEDSKNQTSINISWAVVAGADTYQIFRNTSSIGYTTNLYYNDTGLTADTTYGYEVRVNDSYDNWGMNSSELVVTTQNAEVIPPHPVSLSNSTGNFWVHFSWSAGTGNVTNSYNVSYNGIWDNTSSNTSRNESVGAHGYFDIIVYAYNSSGNGTLSTGYITDNMTVPNNAITISDVSASYTLNEGETLSIDADYSDVDGDTGTFTDNSSEWNVNSGTGIVSWVTENGDDGTYYYYIQVSDGYGSTDTQVFTVTVNNSIVIVPTIDEYSNSISGSNMHPVVTYGGSITFTASTDEAVDTWTWYVDDVDQSNNADNLIISWSAIGHKTVEVYAANAAGTSNTVTWYPYIKQQMASGPDEVLKLSEAGYDTLLDEIAVDNPNFETILYATTEPYTDIIGNVFFLILWGLPMVMLWIKQESMLMPCMFGLIMGTLLLAFLPSSFATTASAMIVLSLMGIIYMWAKAKR